MNWSRERPKEGGFYWLRWPCDLEPTIGRVSVFGRFAWDGDVVIPYIEGTTLLSKLEAEEVEFFGPLEPPDYLEAGTDVANSSTSPV